MKNFIYIYKEIRIYNDLFQFQVRTKDRVFDSVSHLVNHHCDNVLPIISADSVLVLRYPIPRRTNN